MIESNVLPRYFFGVLLICLLVTVTSRTIRSPEPIRQGGINAEYDDTNQGEFVPDTKKSESPMIKYGEVDYIQPVNHVKQINGEYVAYPDIEPGTEEEKVPKKDCIPRDQAPESAITLIRQGGINAEYDPENQGEIDDDPYNGFVFNDTSSSNITDVGETVQLRLIRPLCDD